MCRRCIGQRHAGRNDRGHALYASVTTLSASNDSPDLILGNVETILRNQLGEGHYVTIFYGVFDLNSRVLDYV